MPIVMALPGVLEGGGAVTDRVRNVDIAPTVLDVEGLEADPRMSGRSMLPLAHGTAGGRAARHHQRGARVARHPLGPLALHRPRPGRARGDGPGGRDRSRPRQRRARRRRRRPAIATPRTRDSAGRARRSRTSSTTSDDPASATTSRTSTRTSWPSCALAWPRGWRTRPPPTRRCARGRGAASHVAHPVRGGRAGPSRGGDAHGRRRKALRRPSRSTRRASRARRCASRRSAAARPALRVSKQVIDFALATSPEAALGFDVKVDPPGAPITWQLFLDDAPWPEGRTFAGPFGLPADRGAGRASPATTPRDELYAPAPPEIDPGARPRRLLHARPAGAGRAGGESPRVQRRRPRRPRRCSGCSSNGGTRTKAPAGAAPAAEVTAAPRKARWPAAWQPG